MELYDNEFYKHSHNHYNDNSFFLGIKKEYFLYLSFFVSLQRLHTFIYIIWEYDDDSHFVMIQSTSKHLNPLNIHIP